MRHVESTNSELRELLLGKATMIEVVLPKPLWKRIEHHGADPREAILCAMKESAALRAAKR